MTTEIRIKRAARSFNHYAHTARHKTLTWDYDMLCRYVQRETISRRLLVSIIEALWDCPTTADVTWDGETITVRVM